MIGEEGSGAERIAGKRTCEARRRAAMRGTEEMGEEMRGDDGEDVSGD